MGSVGFRWFGLRQADVTKRCACMMDAPADGIATPKKSCKRCLGIGFLFTDYLVKGYVWLGILGVSFGTQAGRISTQSRNIVLHYDRPINKFDWILDLDTDPETGELRQPFRVMRAFEVQDSMPLHGKNGRVEFWKAIIEERNISDGRPGEDGTNFNYGGSRSFTEPK